MAGEENFTRPNDFLHRKPIWPKLGEIIVCDIDTLPADVRATLVRERIAKLHDIPIRSPVQNLKCILVPVRQSGPALIPSTNSIRAARTLYDRNKTRRRKPRFREVKPLLNDSKGKLTILVIIANMAAMEEWHVIATVQK